MLRKIKLSLLFLFLTLLCYAGDVDSNYVQKFKNIFAVKFFLNNNGFRYTITPRNNALFTDAQLKDAQVIYTPNIPATMGITVNIKGVGLTYVFKLQKDYFDASERIVSDYKLFQLNMYGSKFGIEAYYQDYKRFYYHYNGDAILSQNYNSDIRAYQWGANGVFIFNGDRFSYNAAFNQSQLQKKSAGSWMLITALKYSELKSSDLIPDSVKGYYGVITDLERNRNYAFILQTGYGCNITKNNFYVSAALLGGAGIQLQTYTYPVGKVYRTGFPLVGRGKASIGYNGKIFFTGLYANADVTQSNITFLKTQQMHYSCGFYLGVRAIKYSKTKAQLKQQAKHDKWLKDDAAKKAKEEKKKLKQQKKKK